ncbi:hypothetical protein POSPLADRAFT_1043657 [Postia placenta MAD-698-R-SB12]|uniref:Uncharacterized protein n=1 Tax=Postia placenta MAD-698-R-SB12 TaxID=670580 RepID=A0A1X6NCK2_9APHY|nr:hypothetical protein POSPLADRAFT_1043657 [Postia placenta MAD-698-R-SB12]OSX66176.1 hypothetical protein POSPLADRAFT_1043657 [Postia placenta MAD-698-R-SB12]
MGGAERFLLTACGAAFLAVSWGCAGLAVWSRPNRAARAASFSGFCAIEGHTSRGAAVAVRAEPLRTPLATAAGLAVSGFAFGGSTRAVPNRAARALRFSSSSSSGDLGAVPWLDEGSSSKQGQVWVAARGRCGVEGVKGRLTGGWAGVVATSLYGDEEDRLGGEAGFTSMAAGEARMRAMRSGLFDLLGTTTAAFARMSLRSTTLRALLEREGDAHPQSHLYNFYPQPHHPAQHPHPAQPHHPAHPSRQPSPQPSPLSTPVSQSAAHNLFLHHPEPQHRDHDPPVDQIQDDAPLDEEPLYMDKDLDRSSDMAVDSPADARPPFSPIHPQQPPEKKLEYQAAPIPPTLQPRPQPVQQQAHLQTAIPQPQPQFQLRSPVSPHLQGQPMQPQNSVGSQAQMHSQSHGRAHPQARSPYESHIPLGHHPETISLLNVGYHHPLSHPATPDSLSPHHPAMADGMPSRDHVHAAVDTQHDHSRHSAASGSSSVGGHLAQNAASAQSAAPHTSGGQSSINLRSPYAAMQMHHVPHPHAHARHRHTYINSVERLYPEEQDVLDLGADSLKNNLQTGNDLLQYSNGSGNTRR